jgi:predicted RecB family nuclease
MGQAKKAMMEEEEKGAVAISIAVRAGVLKYCDRHSNHYHPSDDLTPAYKLGNYLITNGEVDNFDDSRDMTDHVKEAVESAADECYACADIRDND